MTNRTRACAVMAVLLTLLPLGLFAQQAPQRPTFRSGIDLIEVDVTVVDGQGEPVADLRAPEFAVTIDGQPRRVVTAEFIDLRAETPERAPASVDAGEGFYSSNTEVTRGRLIVLMIDRDNMAFGTGSTAASAAARFVERLPSHDRVALVTLPQPGPLVDFTANHDLVRNAVDGLVGLRTRLPGLQNIGMYEALELVRAGQFSFVSQSVVRRVCGARQENVQYEQCVSQVERDSALIVQDQRRRTDNSLRALESTLDALRTIDGPKHLVWLTQGLVIDGPTTVIRPIERSAAAARVTIHVLLVDTPEVDVTTALAPPTRREDRQQEEQGISLLAGTTRGDLLRAGPNADAAFERLETELSGYYLLGVESLSSDQEGDSYEIDVKVGRRGTRVRSRREVLLPASDEEPDGGIDERMERALQSPFAATGLPLRVATYVFRAEDPAKVRVTVPLEIDAVESSPSEVVIGFSLRDVDGNIVSSGRQQVTLNPVERPRGAVLEHVISFITDPGSYVARVAVADGRGQSGSVEHPVQAWQLADVPFASGDLLLADASTGAPDELAVPVEARVAGDRLAVYTELYSDEPTGLDSVQVRVDVAESASGEPLVTGMGAPEPGDDPNSRVVSAIFPIHTLPPGRYLARAVVTREDERLAHLSRPFLVTRPLAPGAPRAAGRASTSPDATMPAPATSEDVVRGLLGETLAFKSGDLLTAEVVSFFMDRLDEGRPALKEVTSEVRAGDLAGAGRRAFLTGDQTAAAFLQGLDLFAQSKWNQAATQFSIALSGAPDFAPAAFYLGACYAVGGRDSEAASHWRRALLAPETAPIEHGVLADALFRSSASREAVTLLQEALTVWPKEGTLLRRLAIGHALELEHDETLAVIEPYIEQHSTDDTALLLALSTMFRGHVDGSAPLAGDSLERMRTYADAYGTADGPHLGLVLDWVRFVSGP